MGDKLIGDPIIFILAAVFKGQKVTSAQVRDYAYKANPDINQETLNDAIRSGMSNLGRTDRINVTPRTNRKLGHLYSAKLEDVQRLAA
jgi:isopentenyl phosphate kinase